MFNILDKNPAITTDLKGNLLRAWIISKSSNSQPSFETSDISPFVCTVSIVLKEGSQPIYIKSDPFSSKKAADKHAAELALNDPRVQAAFNLKPHSLVTQNNLTMEKYLPGDFVGIPKEVSNGTTLPLQTSISATTCIIQDTSSFVEPKGLLIGRVARIIPSCLPPVFETVAVTTLFVSTVSVWQIGCNGTANKMLVSARGHACSTKTEAAQVAAQALLAKCSFIEQPKNKLSLVISEGTFPSSSPPCALNIKPSGEGDCEAAGDTSVVANNNGDSGNGCISIHCGIGEMKHEIPKVCQKEVNPEEEPVLSLHNSERRSVILPSSDGVMNTTDLGVDMTVQEFTESIQCSAMVTTPAPITPYISQNSEEAGYLESEVMNTCLSVVADVNTATSTNCAIDELENDITNIPHETEVSPPETALNPEGMLSSTPMNGIDFTNVTTLVIDTTVQSCSAEDESTQCSSGPAITVPITAHVSVQSAESMVSTPRSSVSASTSRTSVVPTTMTYKSQLMELVLKIVPPILTPWFETTDAPPFVCTITLSRRDINGTVTVLLETTGQGCSRKKDAAHAAAQTVLEDPVFLSLQNCHYSSPQSTDVAGGAYSAASGDVCCAGCNGCIGDIASFFFYDKSETEVQFALKPEVAKLVLGAARQDCTALHLPKVRLVDSHIENGHRLQKKYLSCTLCNQGIGVYMKTGPNNAPLSSFGIEKILLLGSGFAASARWRDIAKNSKFFGIEHRTDDTFYGYPSGNDNQAMRPHNNTPIKFPVLEGASYLESPDFQVNDLLSADCTKDPRPEQLRALHLALQAHMIVVFPTGFGKTFVAAMFMRRFSKLNALKLVVMVVDRVPLVEQQCRAIHNDTDLLVCPLSGENSTSYVVRELLSGKYDALVVTAGALCNYLNRDELRMSDFSAIVLDECHHVTGEHQYRKLLELVSRCPAHLQPRLLGLTASPFNAKTDESASIKLDNLRNAFLDAEVYRPRVAEQSTEGIERHPVSLTSQQRDEQAELVSKVHTPLNSLVDIYRKFYPELLEKIGSDSIDVSYKKHWCRIANLAAEAHLRHLPEAQKKTAKDVAERVRDLVRALEDNYLMGPAFVTLDGRTPNAAIASAATAGDDNQTVGLSNQLLKLRAVLDKYGEQSSTLVFVDTRYTAELLTSYLMARFPALNCGKVIGQGGVDGMRWRGGAGQGAVLQAFRSGDTKLIVCTSVLEEGETMVAICREKCN